MISVWKIKLHLTQAHLALVVLPYASAPSFLMVGSVSFFKDWPHSSPSLTIFL